MIIESTGIRVDVPVGWDAEVYRREADHFAQFSVQEVTGSVLHIGNFALPLDRGDFGSGAVEIMRSEHVLMVLFEYGSDSRGTALFSEDGLPTVRPEDFSPQQMQRTLPGQAGVQYFFTEQGRPFCLYIVLGAYMRRVEMADAVNEILASVSIE